MRRRGLQPMHDQHINVTPLIDVVMCLIIFFLICGELVALDAQGQVNLPLAKNGQPIPDLRGIVVIRMLPQSSSPGTPPAIVMLGQTIPYPYEALSEGVRLAVSENRDLSIRLYADKTADMTILNPIIKICSDEKVHSLNFATVDEKEGP